jgi:plasmid stabilization system protein ParE
VNKRVVRSGPAEVDLLEHLDYIGVDNPDAALRFIEAVEQAFERLSEMPEIGSVRHFNNPRLSGSLYENSPLPAGAARSFRAQGASAP